MIIRIMKKYILPVMAALLLVSCNKIEEKNRSDGSGNQRKSAAESPAGSRRNC